MRPKAVVAMSGGVDSSVTAALLKDEGYDVTGVMLKLWKGEDINNNSGCCSLGAAEDARRVADVLDIPFYVFNFADRFEQSVIRDFHAQYAAGRTPNPCVRCNQWIKFDILLERAMALDADVLATGHYARIREVGGRYRLLRGVDPNKDQSYVLWMLGQSELARVRLPIGEMNKPDTRRIAAELGLRTAAKPDSQEICFVRGGDVGTYMRDHLDMEPGAIVDGGGQVLGEHPGAARFTVGQRKGLGISLGVPVFVTGVDTATNTVVVGAREELVVETVRVEEASFVLEPPVEGEEVLVQHRAHGEPNAASVTRAAGDGFEVTYDRRVEAMAPGQSAVLYRSDRPEELIGGGYIASTVRAAAVA
ncbi:MAG: tRNA 2-thiouridine(34) synthase MnmA [Actinobacteria bacterium]|nr:tRNA 2-thiouridine(34) synthase MnmA [Actinomycetota bacterium]